MVGLLVLVASVGLGAATASAESFNSEEELNRYVSSVSLASDQAMFIVRSLHPNIIDLEFYADARKHAWPGGNQVYTVKDSHWHTYILNCRRGEKICYGVGVRGSYNKYWGGRHQSPGQLLRVLLYVHRADQQADHAAALRLVFGPRIKKTPQPRRPGRRAS